VEQEASESQDRQSAGKTRFPAQRDELSEIKDIGKEQKRTNIPKRETEDWGYQIFWTMDVSRR